MVRTYPMKIPILTAMAIAALTSLAWASSVVVDQRDRSFGVKEITVPAGAEVTFLNRDIFDHNVYSDTRGATFDIGLQQPGESRSVRFEKPAQVKVRCRIHPKMRLTVNVTG